MRRLTAGVLTLLLLPSLILAADSRLEPPPLDRYLRWGPIRVRPGIGVQNFGYDDNILSNPNQRIGDLTVTLVPRIEGLVLFGDRAFLTFEEQLQYTVYKDNSDQNYQADRGKLRATVPLRRIGLFLDSSWGKVRDRPIDQEDIRPIDRRSGIGGGVIIPFGWRTELEISHQTRKHRYSDPDALDPALLPRQLDRTEKGLELRVGYQLTGRTLLTLDASETSTTFDAVDPLSTDARTLSFLPGVELDTTGALGGSFRLGWAKVRSERGAASGFSRIVGDADLLFRFAHSTRLRFNLKRELGYSISSGNDFFLQTEIGVRGTHFLTRYLGVDLGITQGVLDFPESDDLIPRRDDLDSYIVGMRFRLPAAIAEGRADYVLKVERYRRDSNLDTLDNSQTRIGLDLEFGF